MKQVDIRNLSVAREGNVIFKNLNLSMEAGRIHAICGNTGSGKSLLLQAIAGVLPESENTIFLNGEAVRPAHIAIAQQKAVLYNHMTGMDYLKFLQADNSPWVRELNNYFNLPLQNSTDHYSNGMLHQLRIMGAFAEQKAVTLIDEPFHSLDRNNIIYLKKIMQTILGPTRTIITTHSNNQEAIDYAHKIHLLSNGAIKETISNELTGR